MKLVIDEALKKNLKPELVYLNESLESLAKDTDGFTGELLSYVLVGSGKRVRPALVHLTAQLGPSKIDEVRSVAQAVELIHIATLIHDDVIDKAALRRGMKTVVNEHGVDTAVLLGDHIYTYAFERVAELGHPQLLKMMARATSLMCAGEIEQLRHRYQFDLGEREYFSFIHKKTASLFGISAQAGALLSGQPPLIQKAMENFGIFLGTAFQIVDDLLDLTGEEAVVGKTLRTDLLNGKMTLPLIHYRENTYSPMKAAEFYELLRNPNEGLMELVEEMREAGSIKYANDVAHDHIERALRELQHLPPSKAKDLLAELAEMLSIRQA